MELVLPNNYVEIEEEMMYGGFQTYKSIVAFSIGRTVTIWNRYDTNSNNGYGGVLW